MIGKTISHYRITEKLGEGGMGVVYKAEDAKLKRTVALKFLSPQAVGYDEEHARFQHEAQAAAALSHPNICTIHEIDEAEGHSFIAMEYIEGQSLQDKIASQPLKIDEAIDIACQIADGLHQAHEKGIVHRDIKPANIMLTNTGQVKILDFGIAKLAGQPQITKTGAVPGTPAYMSPEQIKGEKATTLSDLWALGAVLYELLSGSPPFAGEYEVAVAYAIVHDDPPLLSQVNPDLPAALDSLVARAMARDPQARYRSCLEFRSDLETMASVRPPQQGSAPRSMSQTYSRKRRLIKRITVGTLVLVIAMAAAALWFFYPFLTNPDLSPQVYQKSLAVLFFRNLSQSVDNRYFSDGLTEELIARLSRVRDLDVKSRTDVLRYRNRAVSVQELAQELGVDAIVEGSVRKYQDKVRVNVQLIDTESGRSLWTEAYEERLDDLFGVQDEIASRIANALELNLTGAEQRNINKAPTVNIDAYDHYLRAKAAMMTWSKEGFDQAEILLLKAIERDRNFSDAHAHLAFLQILRTYFHYTRADSVLEVAATASERALELEAENEIALLSSAGASMLRVQNYRQKLSLFEGRRLIVTLKKILELNPRSLLGNLGMAHYYEWFRHDQEHAKLHFTVSLNSAERMADLEPGNKMASGIAAQCAGRLAWIARNEGNLDYGVELTAKARRYSPQVSRSYFQEANFRIEMGQYQQAIAVAAEGTKKVTSGNGLGSLYLLLAHLVSKYPNPDYDPLALLQQARLYLDQIISTGGSGFCASFAELCRRHGEIDFAVSMLNEAVSLDSEQSIASLLILGNLYSQEQDYTNALAVYQEALERSEQATDRLADVHQARGVLMTFILLGKQEEFAKADSLVRHWIDVNQTDSWLKQALELYAGRGNASSLRSKLSSEDTFNSRFNHVAVLYYLGMNAMLSGDRTGARRLFTEAVDSVTGFDEYRGHIFIPEYIAARAELARL
jgi:serine/threonine protein kinase/tetratricopeptide (TPR) repeat protein/Tfp pilus assembly protein PilF